LRKANKIYRAIQAINIIPKIQAINIIPKTKGRIKASKRLNIQWLREKNKYFWLNKICRLFLNPIMQIKKHTKFTKKHFPQEG